MRETDAWAIEHSRDPRRGAHGARRGRTGVGGRAGGTAEDGSSWCAARATTGATGTSSPACCVTQGRDVVVLTTAPVTDLAGDARHHADRLPGAPPRDVHRVASGGRGARGRRDPGHRRDRRSPRQREGRDRGDRRVGRTRGARRRSERRRRHARARSPAPRSRAVATATFHAGQAGAVDRAGQSALPAPRRLRHRYPAGAPVDAADVGPARPTRTARTPTRGATARSSAAATCW